VGVKVPLMRGPNSAGENLLWLSIPPPSLGATPSFVIMNQTMARQYFGNDSPIRRRVTLDAVSYEIVAVVGDG
jgi:hypothetical protein